mmetsp:Transcript_86545/g.279334  ORF Transcript_86545/g.279334 Transcript_86545/m.279334 type:complete len:255 (-) Transcript_86545:467-1231(-)
MMPDVPQDADLIGELGQAPLPSVGAVALRQLHGHWRAEKAAMDDDAVAACSQEVLRLQPDLLHAHKPALPLTQTAKLVQLGDNLRIFLVQFVEDGPRAQRVVRGGLHAVRRPWPPPAVHISVKLGLAAQHALVDDEVGGLVQLHEDLALRPLEPALSYDDDPQRRAHQNQHRRALVHVVNERDLTAPENSHHIDERARDKCHQSRPRVENVDGEERGRDLPHEHVRPRSVMLPAKPRVRVQSIIGTSWSVAEQR